TLFLRHFANTVCFRLPWFCRCLFSPRVLPGVNSLNSRLRFRHLTVAALERLFLCPGDLINDLRFSLLESGLWNSVTLQVRFIHSDRVAFAPVFEHRFGNNLPCVIFVMRGVAAHSKSLRKNDNGAMPGSCELSRQFCCRVRV